MFYGCSSLVDAPKISANVVSSSSCLGMFNSCTSLTIAPDLPATKIGPECYQAMFENCKSLIVAPSLPAIILRSYCYRRMFFGCSNLVTAPKLPAKKLGNNSYEQMFTSCSKLNYIEMLCVNASTSSLKDWVSYVAKVGTFVKHPNNTSLASGASGIPSGWNVVDYDMEGEELQFTIKDTYTNIVYGPYIFKYGTNAYDWYISNSDIYINITNTTGGIGVIINGRVYNVIPLDELLEDKEYEFSSENGGEPL
jgi:hypothetical protein